MNAMNRFSLTLCAALALSLPIAARAQDPTDPPATKPTAKRPSSRAKVEVLRGTLSKIDVEKKFVTIKTAGSERDIFARADDLTEILKEGKPAKLSDFAEGDKVTARVSLKPNATAGSLKSLFDEKTSVSQATQKAADAEGKVVVSSLTNIDIKLADGSVKTYRVNARTLFVKADKPATTSDFKPGDAVAVRPRGLPTGTVQAVIVADKKAALETAHQDGLATWTAVVEKFDDGALVVKRADGAVRSVVLTESTTVSKGKNPLTKTDLKEGVKVKLHLVKGAPDDRGRRTTDKITLSAR